MTTKPSQLDENRILAESQALLKQGRDVAASTLLENFLSKYPFSRAGLQVLAQVRRLQKQPQAAASLLQLALDIHGSQATVIHAGSFDKEDAEYLEQEHERRTDCREYDLFSEVSIQRNDTNFSGSSSPIDDFRAHKERDSNFKERDGLFDRLENSPQQVEPKPMDAASSLSSSLSSQDIYVAGNEPASLVDESKTCGDTDSDSERTDQRHKDDIDSTHGFTVGDLLDCGENFAEHVIYQEVEPIHVAELQLKIDADQDDIHLEIDDESDEWETLAVADDLDEESVWESTAHPAEIDQPPTPRDFSEFPDRLTRAERALQVAMNVGTEFGWDRAGIKLLAIIFDRYWWSASQVAIRRELASGMTPHELVLAEDVRQIWYQHPEFWSASGASGEIVQRYSLISWPTALSLIRSFKGYPQAEEVESLLNEYFEKWYDSDRLQRRFPGFYSFALYCVGSYGDLPEYDGWVLFDAYSTDDSDFSNTGYVERQLDQYGIHVDARQNAFNRVVWEELDGHDYDGVREAREANEDSNKYGEEQC